MRTLFHVNGSISSWRVLLALHEKALAFEGKRLRIMSTPRPTRQPEFLALNPRGKAPVLVDEDGTRINESLAILTWLELRYPAPSLLPTALQAQATALAWAQESEETSVVYEPIEQLFVTRPAALSEGQRKAIQGALEGLRFELGLWEARLHGRSFLVEDTFSIADCAFYPVLAYLERRGLGLEGYSALQQYSSRIRHRPAAMASFPEGWEHRTGKVDLFKLAASV